MPRGRNKYGDGLCACRRPWGSDYRMDIARWRKERPEFEDAIQSATEHCLRSTIDEIIRDARASDVESRAWFLAVCYPDFDDGDCLEMVPGLAAEHADRIEADREAYAGLFRAGLLAGK